MKRLFVFSGIILVCFVVCLFVKEDSDFDVSSVFDSIETSETTHVTEEIENFRKNEIYGVWLTYTEIGELVKGKTENEYRESLDELFDNLTEGKINTVFYQCRAFCDSLYSSEIFPVSKYLLSEKENELSYDPFRIFLEKGKEKGVKVHCWVNPFRISYSEDLELLPESSPVHQLYEENKNTLIICDKGVFFNPASEDARAFVLKGIREILNKYDVDGLHFDDYFYPETDDMGDEKLYSEYKKQGGQLTLPQWRRENVSAFVSGVYSLVKSIDENLLFGISPVADIKKCTEVFYADIEKWCKEDGFSDYVIPQIYFGFENEKSPFSETLKEWEEISLDSNVQFVCGLAPYKCGEIDKNAGSGEEEWTENVNILSRQYEQIAESQVWQGFSLFSYSYSFGENMNKISKKEIKALLDMIE